MAYNNRFIRKYKDSRWAGVNEIWVDVETGVNYLYHASGYSGGLTVLTDAEGRPIVSDRRELDELRYMR